MPMEIHVLVNKFVEIHVLVHKFVEIHDMLVNLGGFPLNLPINNPFVFSSPGPKVHVNYCHHLASVVCRL